MPACLLTTLIFSSAGHASIYKWVDSEGNVHYGQQKPADASAEKMKVERHAPQDTSSYTRPSLKKDNENKADIKDDEKKTDDTKNEPKKPMTAAEKKQRKAACKQARDQLVQMKAKGRIRSKDKDGNLIYMDPEQKASRMKQMRDAIAKACK